MGNNKRKYTDKAFIRAIQGGYVDPVTKAKVSGSAGIISTIAGRMGCDWNTAKLYCTTYPAIIKAYQDECERVKDAAESVILKNISESDIEASKWYLSKKAKDRGYGERVDHLLNSIDFRTLTQEQLDRIAAGEDILKVITSGSQEAKQ